MIINAGQCSCKGNNPDCFRCSGTGMVQTPDLMHPHSEAYEMGQLLSKLPRKPERVVYEMLVRPKKIKKPVVKVAMQPVKKAKKAVKPVKSLYRNVKNYKAPEVCVMPLSIKPVKKIPANIECPICCTHILKTIHSFSNHLISHDSADTIKHKKLIDKTFQLIAQTPSVVLLAPLSSPKMNIFTNRSAPYSAPKGKSKKPIASKFSDAKIIPSTDEPPGSRFISREADTKKLDSTFGQHTIREGGRYGSHPAHDNFDDESGA